jgi:hypothetical protein
MTSLSERRGKKAYPRVSSAAAGRRPRAGGLGSGGRRHPPSKQHHHQIARSRRAPPAAAPLPLSTGGAGREGEGREVCGGGDAGARREEENERGGQGLGRFPTGSEGLVERDIGPSGLFSDPWIKCGFTGGPHALDGTAG